MGLNDDLYSTLRSQILALDPLPSLDKIFNMTQQEENHKRVMMTRDTWSSRGGQGAGRNRGYGRESAAAAIHQEASPNNVSGPPAASGLGTKTSQGSGERAQVPIPGLTSEQVEWLLSLIDTPKLGYKRLSGKALWMLDIGASAHMVGDVNLVSNLQRVSPIAIGLPNGDCTVARLCIARVYFPGTGRIHGRLYAILHICRHLRDRLPVHKN